MTTNGRNGERVADRRAPRIMLALIVLADLPVPSAVHVYADTGILSLDFERIADGRAWGRHLGGAVSTYPSKGRSYLNHGTIGWYGWSVRLHASEPAPTEHGELGDAMLGRLEKLLATGWDGAAGG